MTSTTTGSVTVPQGAALTIGAVLGTGVIALPALAAQTAGPASLVAWAALVLLSVPLAGTFAALGARHPDAGGVSTYARLAFGRRAAIVVGWCFYFAVVTGAPAAAMFAGAYVEAALGGGDTTILVTMTSLVVVVTAANLCGIRVSGRAQVVLASTLVVLLVAAVVTALPHVRLDNLQPFAPEGWLAVAPAAAVLVWGFAGWEAVTSLAADYRRPERDLPRVTAVAVAVVGVLYLALAATSLLVLGAATGATDAPLAELLAIGVGADVRLVTAAIAVLLTLGAMNAYFAGGAKLGAALGRDGALPGWFATGSRVGEVPRRSLCVLGGLALAATGLVAVSGVGARSWALLTTGSFTLVYVVGTAAAVRLLPRGSWGRRAALVSLVAVVLLLVVSGAYVLWALGVAAAAVTYDVVVRSRSAGDAVADPTDDELGTVAGAAGEDGVVRVGLPGADR